MRPRLTYANVVSTVCLFLLLAGGSAIATHPGGQDTISTADIQNGQVKEADVGEAAVASHELKNDSILPDDVAPDSLGSGRIATGAVRTEEVANGQVQAEDLAPGVAPGASGARAWGHVGIDGTLLRSKQVTSVTPNANGSYCIDPAPGINPLTAILLVGQDFRFDATGQSSDNVSHAEWVSSGACPSDALGVHTFVGDGRAATNGELDVGGFDLVQQDQPFTFVIP